MKRIDFDFENMGGLAELYAIPPSDVLRLRLITSTILTMLSL